MFWTSRREIPIRHGFSNMPDIIHQDLDLGEIPRQLAEHDISVYLKTEFERISGEHQLSNWPGPGILGTLLEKCDMLFIYAFTICKFIGDRADSPKERLAIILQTSSSAGSELPELDSMYATVLEHPIKSMPPGLALNRYIERFQRVIGSFIVLFDNLSASSLSSLLDLSLSEQILVAFRPYQSLIHVPRNIQDPLRAIHPSLSRIPA